MNAYRIFFRPLMFGAGTLLIGNALVSLFVKIDIYSFSLLNLIALIAIGVVATVLFYAYIKPLHQVLNVVNEEGLSDDRLAALHSTDESIQAVLTLASSKSRFQSSSKDLSDTSSQSAISAAEVSFSVSKLRDKIELQAKELEHVEESSNTIADIGENIAKNSDQARLSSQQAFSNSTNGRKVLNTTHLQIKKILDETEHAHQDIELLASNAEKIKKVTLVIEDIAEQTNLLALNAAIEAARAGDMGRGFAVVSDEVRNLAGRTAEATNEVSKIIEDNHQKTAEVVSLFKTLANDVREGTNRIQNIENIFSEVEEQVSDVESRIVDIAENAQENHKQLQVINQSISTINSEMIYGRDHIKSLDEQAVQFTGLAEKANALLAEVASDGIHQKVYRIAINASEKIQKTFEQSIAQQEISETQLFDRNYMQVGGSNPPKYKTLYDQYADSVLPDIQELVLAENDFLAYAIATDDKSYVPTHNNKFCQPLTGDYEKDLVGNRTKRLFNDKTGARCGSHTNKLLLQTYKRDTGEIMHDLSVPIYVNGRHWGGFRIGYVS